MLEDIHTLTGRRKSDPPLTVRRILVYSAGNAAAQAKARGKRLAKARAELENLERLAGSRYYPTREKIAAKIGVIAKQRRVGEVLHTEITDGPDGPGSDPSQLVHLTRGVQLHLPDLLGIDLS